jgi:mannitol-1-phosphate 5-dehydrogenase
MRGTAVQFGAGNIGRGFLAQLFHESRLEVVFVDVAEPVVEAINARGEYTIQIVGPGAETVPITGVRAVHGRDRVRVAEEIAQAEIVCTAVGANALAHIAPAIAAGLLARHKSVGTPLNILLCENLHDAASALKAAVMEHLPERYHEEILPKTGFVQAVVARMVPFQTEADRAADLLAIKVEAYKRLPIDAHAIVGEWQPLVGIEPVENFEAWVERKLYVHNCAHAVLGYCGWASGHEYGYEAIRDPEIRNILDGVLDETGLALLMKHRFDPAEHAAHVVDLKIRFQNEALGDPCRRLARDPIRKLAPDDRLVGAARLCEQYGVQPNYLAAVIALAMTYSDPEDPSAVRLHSLLTESGPEAALRDICRIEPDEPLGQKILTHLTRRSI